MAKSRMKQIESKLDLLILGLIPLHLYLGTSNFINGIDKGYGHRFPTRSYILIGVYLLIVLASDIFMIRYRKFELSGVLCKYWGSASIAAVLVLLLHLAAPGAGDGIKALCLLYTPFLVLAPFLEVLKAPIYGNASLFSVAAMGAFCLFNWAVCRFAAKEEEQEVRP